MYKKMFLVRSVKLNTFYGKMVEGWPVWIWYEV